MSHEDWLKHRQSGLGGSDVSACMGINPWKTPLDVMLDKTGPVQVLEQNSRMKAGHKLETVIAEYWEEATGRKSTNDHKIRIHPEHEFLIANVDRVITSHWDHLEIKPKSTGILEIKTAGYHSWKNWNGEIPQHYYCQLQHYLNVTGYEWGEFAVLVDGHEFHTIKFDRDDEFIELMTDKLVRFWNNYVLAGIEPPPSSEGDLKILYPSHIPEKQIEAEPNVVDLIDQLKAHKEIISASEKTKRECELELKTLMGDAEAIMSGESMLATWKQSKSRKHFDKKSLGSEHPDIIEKYTKEVPGNRVFLVK